MAARFVSLGTDDSDQLCSGPLRSLRGRARRSRALSAMVAWRRSLCTHIQRRRHNPRHDFTRWRFNRDDNGIFIVTRLLQRFELAVQEASRHEMLVTHGDAPRDQRLFALEVDETHIDTITDENVAVAAL